jgi:bifunctional UDP-N-acetylglucosamine pyrophosphorylase/glucosamine-1-phosphate N-acetyltransferase
MDMASLDVVILAAGKGTRMHSDVPKVLHKLAGSPLLQHVINTANSLQADTVQVVVGHGAQGIRDALGGQSLAFVTQEQQLGTGHAVAQALPGLRKGGMALVLYGDVPLIRKETLQELLSLADQKSMAVLTCKVNDPTGLGRIVRNATGKITSIVEHKDATDLQRKIDEINTGIMAMPVDRLHDWLPRLQSNNAQGEYYLTDVVTLALADGCAVHTATTLDEQEVAGINNKLQLQQLERHYQQQAAQALMLKGVTIRDGARFDLRGSLEHGRDTEIDVNVVLEGKVVIGDRVTIGPNCVIKNCTIGAGSEIAANSVLEDATIGNDCHIGPFARIRPGTELADKAKIGNFVEIKKSVLGKGSKVNHLSYVGDSVLGEGVNIGAGTITCNYDGVNKYKTTIGNGVFIGSDSVLVAPVSIADGAFVAAGSVITANVARDELAIGRSRQVNKAGWQKPVKK